MNKGIVNERTAGQASVSKLRICLDGVALTEVQALPRAKCDGTRLLTQARRGDLDGAEIANWSTAECIDCHEEARHDESGTCSSVSATEHSATPQRSQFTLRGCIELYTAHNAQTDVDKCKERRAENHGKLQTHVSRTPCEAWHLELTRRPTNSMTKKET